MSKIEIEKIKADKVKHYQYRYVMPQQEKLAPNH